MWHHSADSCQGGATATWYRRAAAWGNAAAQYNLGVRYSRGEGVSQDDTEASMWFNLAVAGASSETRGRFMEARDAIAQRMTPAQIAEAQRRARERAPTLDP